MTRPYLPERPSPRRSAVRNRARPYSVTLSRKVAASSTLLPQAAPQRVAGLLARPYSRRAAVASPPPARQGTALLGPTWIPQGSVASMGDYVCYLTGFLNPPPSGPLGATPPRVLGLLAKSRDIARTRVVGRALGRPLPEGLAAVSGRSGAAPGLANAREP